MVRRPSTVQPSGPQTLGCAGLRSLSSSRTSVKASPLHPPSPALQTGVRGRSSGDTQRRREQEGLRLGTQVRPDLAPSSGHLLVPGDLLQRIPAWAAGKPRPPAASRETPGSRPSQASGFPPCSCFLSQRVELTVNVSSLLSL